MKKILIYTILIPALIFSSACNEEFLERLPLDSPSSETYFANETELDMAVTGVYNRLWYFPVGIAWFLSFDFASDDGTEMVVPCKPLVEESKMRTMTIPMVFGRISTGELTG